MTIDARMNRLNAGLIALLAFTGLFACFATLPLIWDGAYQFANTLQHGKPHVYVGKWQHAYQGRFHTWPLWWPTVWASKITDHPITLQAIYGMPFLLAPAFSLAVCWWIVRRQAPGLILWALFGIAIGPLPGQCFAINDTLLLHHFLWPIFLAVFVKITRPQLVVVAILIFFQLAQPMGIANCFGAAVAAMLVIWVRPELRRRQLAWAASLLIVTALGVVKVLAYPDSQASDEASWVGLALRWHNGVEWLPLAGLSFFWIAALCAGLATWSADRQRRSRAAVLGQVAVVAAIIGASIWAAWAIDEHRWRLALDYRRFVLPLSFPFFLAATIEGLVVARRGTPLHHANDRAPERYALPIVLAGTFALVLIVQSTLWFGMVRRVRADVNSHPAAVVPASALPWAYGTALDHWSLPTVYLAIEGRTQKKIVLYDEAWAGVMNQQRVPVTEWESYLADPTNGGYYDFRGLIPSSGTPGEGKGGG